MKRFSLTSLLLLLTYFCIAQGKLITDIIDPMFQNASLRNGNQYASVLGNPYLYDDWNIANITSDNKVYEKVLVHYDVYSDNIIAKRGDDEMIINKTLIDGFTVFYKNMEPHTFKKIYLVKNQLPKFLEVLFEGKRTALYQQYIKTLKKGTSVNNGYSSSEASSDKFVDSSTYYIYVNDKYVEYNGKSKQLLEILADKKNELKAYMKKNKLKTKNQEDLVKILEYYETL